MSTAINVGDILRTRAYLNPDKEALYDAQCQQRYSYSALNTRANQLANALSDLGMQAGDRLALLAYNGHEFVESFFGPTKAGLVIMPLNWRLTADELAFILQDGGASALIYHSDFAATVNALRAQATLAQNIKHWICIDEPDCDQALSYEPLLASQSGAEPQHSIGDDDLAFIMYTSGTTGKPKGVVHSHNSLQWAVLATANSSDIRAGDRYLVLLPLFHVGALTPMVSMIYTGCALIIDRNFDPAKTWSLIEQEKISTSLLVPAMLLPMLQVPDLQQFDWSSLRWVMSGAAPVPVATINAYKELGIEIHQVYGLTESCGPACLIGPDDAMRKIGSTGKAFFHCEVRIADDQGNSVPPGVTGEVLVRGRNIMKEYWNRPEATAETLRDGWLHTGDIAVCDEEGFITIADRIKDMIISGGENVYPAEIENVSLEHPQIVDAAVIGQPSEKWGESPFAIVVTSAPDLNQQSVLQHCKGKLASYKLPKGVSLVDSIPRNPSGKVLKRVLREQFPGPAPQ